MGRFVSLWWLMGCCLLVACSGEDQRHTRIPAVPQNSGDIRNQAALEALTRAINQSSPASAYAKRAALYMDLGKTGEALSDINEALDRDDNEGRYHFVKAKVLRKRQLYEDGLESALRAEGLGVNTPELYIVIGDLLQQQKELDRARFYLVKALQMAPYEGEAFYLNGLVAAKSGDTARAVSFYNRALTLKPRFLEPYVQLSVIHGVRGNYPAAIAYNKRGTAYFPNDPGLMYALGRIYQQTSVEDSAYHYYRRALQLQPTMIAAQLQSGLVMMKIRNMPQALVHFDQVLKLDPKYPRINFYRAMCYEQMRQWEQAISLYALAMQENAGDQQAYYGYWRVRKRNEYGYGTDLSAENGSSGTNGPRSVLDTTRVRVMMIQPRTRIGRDSTRN
ncbi:tetratricopeptide repeat protein [Larkinella insperata]|uniref:Tetratricopeptide repeat protein n=1 Tax=Larkinella insperata TaxID=332158 RepID=A0ABW3QDV3_9BACT|nr:tetratricopeptide repeat protein [Larkinella insperata]